MNITQIKTTLLNAGIEEASKEAEIFVEHYLGLNNVKLALNPEFTPSDELINAKIDSSSINLSVASRNTPSKMIEI